LLGRWGEPEELAKAVVFLASEDSSYVNEVELIVDGGATGAPFGAPILFVAELGERLAHDRSAVCAHEFSRIPTIAAEIRTPPYPMWNLLRVSSATASTNSL
jgi:hypothetical protein